MISSDDRQQAVKNLIHDYLQIASFVCAAFMDSYEATELLSAVRTRKIPRSGGIVVNGENCEYQFHGTGINVVGKTFEIDFDIADPDGCAGIEAWKLAEFAKNQPTTYPQAQKEIEEGLTILLNQGFLRIKNTEPHPHLLVLV